MSRGIHAKFKLLKIEHNQAHYAYGGSNFSYPYDEEIFNSLDGRIIIPLPIFYENSNIADAVENLDIQIMPCHYAEFNFQGIDIFALKTIWKITSLYKETNQLPENGMWVC